MTGSCPTRRAPASPPRRAATIDVTPWETAGGGKAVSCAGPAACSATVTFSGATGRYTVRVRYFDQNNGLSRFVLRIGDRVADRWTADDTLPTKEPHGHSSTSGVVDDVSLTTGDTIVVEGTPDGDEHAPLDYVEIVPAASRYQEQRDPDRHYAAVVNGVTNDWDQLSSSVHERHPCAIDHRIVRSAAH